MTRYGNVKALKVLGNTVNKHKVVAFQYVTYQGFLPFLITVFIFRISSISANSKILTGK